MWNNGEYREDSFPVAHSFSEFVKLLRDTPHDRFLVRITGTGSPSSRTKITS